MRLLLATMNPGKLRDFAAASSPGVLLEPLAGLASLPTPEETGSTFQENALLKATAYSLFAPGAIVLADDSGLEVDGLDGAPGVRSARFAEDRCFQRQDSMSADERNNLCLLEELASRPMASRSARYRCVLAAARDGEAIATGEGAVDGEILEQPRGTAGFGYDPLFLLPQLAETMAELSTDQKLALSHRGRALRDLLTKLSAAEAVRGS